MSQLERMRSAQTYAIPVAGENLAWHLTLEALDGIIASWQVVGTGSTHPLKGHPETLVKVTGDSRAHSAMLGRYEWCGF